MSRRHQALQRICAALLLCTAAALCALITSAVPTVPSAGAQAPAVDLAGNPLDPLKASPGKAVILIFVRTDCPISNRYAPTIQQLSVEYAAKASFWLVYPGPRRIRGNDPQART